MNIAYLVIAFNKPEQLQRLVARLDQDNAHFFIHIDKKNPNAGSFRDLFVGKKNVTFISVYKVYWGGFSQVKTALHLLKLATTSPTDFKYHILLSGQDYPIKTNEYINDFFSSHSCDFLSYNRVADLPISFTNKYRYYHNLDIKYINPKDPHKNKLLYYLYYGLYKRIGKYLPHRSFYKGFTPYFGSDWLALTNDSAKFIIAFTEEHKDYVQFMKYTEIPSELFIHNILLNTERKTNLCGYDKFLKWLQHKKDGEVFAPEYSSLRYMDWSDRGKQHTKPAILDISYFDALKTDKNLFARKLDDTISADLLDKIDKELLR